MYPATPASIWPAFVVLKIEIDLNFIEDIEHSNLHKLFIRFVF